MYALLVLSLYTHPINDVFYDDDGDCDDDDDDDFDDKLSVPVLCI